MMKAADPKFSVAQNGNAIAIYHVDAGEGLPKHDHKQSHITFCTHGVIKVSNERRSLVMTKDTQPVNLLANEWHEIEALEDGTVFVNVFSEGKN